MKMQNHFLRGNAVAFTFLMTLVSILACHAQTNRAKHPADDIHTAAATGNIEALKQHLAAGTDINKKDPMGESSPLLTYPDRHTSGSWEIFLYTRGSCCLSSFI